MPAAFLLHNFFELVAQVNSDQSGQFLEFQIFDQLFKQMHFFLRTLH